MIESNNLPAGKLRKFLVRVYFAGVLSLLAASAPATIINVPADQPTIQQAINAADHGDFILVSPGTYAEHLNYSGKAISIQSTAGPENTVIDGTNNGAVVTFQTHEGPQSTLSGFTIRRGSASFGAGVTLLGASPTITDNIFRDNNQGGGGFGAAIGGNSASPVIEGNTFQFNSCDTQSLSGVVSFVNSSSPHIYNNIFGQNQCRAINMTLPEATVRWLRTIRSCRTASV